MATWLDRFTGQKYLLSDEQLNGIRDSVAQAVAAILRNQSTPHAQANAVAQWWQTDYYERVFPLRFGRQSQEAFSEGTPLKYVKSNGTLALPDSAEWRTAFLDGLRFPPILPAETQPDLEKPLPARGRPSLSDRRAAECVPAPCGGERRCAARGAAGRAAARAD
jgi:hypothetical protein